MDICNIVFDPDIDWNSESGKLLAKHNACPAVNVISDITHLNTSVPTLFYGKSVAEELWNDKVSIGRKQLSAFHWWSYTVDEIPYECWIDEFVEDAAKNYFKYVSNGIDVVFDEFDLGEFLGHLNPFPLVHKGGYEIYIADWRDREIIIHSIKMDTLEYIGIGVDEFLHEIYELLDYDFLTIETNRYDFYNNDQEKYPIFLDELLFANSDEWVGIDELIDYYSVIHIDRPKVITYYLRQSEYLREKFNIYR